MAKEKTADMKHCPFCEGFALRKIQSADPVKEDLDFYLCRGCRRVFEVNAGKGGFTGQKSKGGPWIAGMPPRTMRWRKATTWDIIPED